MKSIFSISGYIGVFRDNLIDVYDIYIHCSSGMICLNPWLSDVDFPAIAIKKPNAPLRKRIIKLPQDPLASAQAKGIEMSILL